MFFFTRFVAVLRRIEMEWLLAAAIVHYFSFWGFLTLTEAPDAKIIEPVNFWYYWWTSALTIGYGDLSPTAIWARFGAGFFMLAGVVLFAALLTKLGTMLTDRISRKRRGLMPTKAKNHILIIGDFDHKRVTEILGNAAFDEIEKGKRPSVVCCFRNCDDRNPLDTLQHDFHGIVPEFVQAGPNGIDLQALTSANALGAASIYVIANEDTIAAGIISALSRLEPAGKVAVLLKDHASEELLPRVSFDLRVIVPLQSLVAVRELNDEGSGAIITDLVDSETGESIYTLPLTLALPCSYGRIRAVFAETFGEAAILIGFYRKGANEQSSYLRPKLAEKVGTGDRLVYIADKPLAPELVQQFLAQVSA